MIMTLYATKDDYIKYGTRILKEDDYSKYSSKILADEEIEYYLELASIDINKATLTRIEKRGFKNLTEQQQNLIIKATCFQAEYIKEKGLYEDDDNVSSYSIGGDLTVNEKESQELSDRLHISRLALSYLRRTGLTPRII